MPRVKCNFCKNTVRVSHQRYISVTNYIAVCFECYKKKEKPEEFRCKGVSSRGDRCNAWKDYNRNSDYCKYHKRDKNETI